MFFAPSIKIRLSRRRSFGSRKLAAKRTLGLFGLEISSLIKSIPDLLQSFSLKIDLQENHPRRSFLATGGLQWPLGESNPDALRHKILSLACLPISPSGHQFRRDSNQDSTRCRRFGKNYLGIGFRHWELPSALGSPVESPIDPLDPLDAEGSDPAGGTAIGGNGIGS